MVDLITSAAECRLGGQSGSIIMIINLRWKCGYTRYHNIKIGRNYYNLAG